MTGPPSTSPDGEKREGQSATDDYLAKEDAERAKMAKLKALRQATEAKVAGEPKTEPGRKGKR